MSGATVFANLAIGDEFIAYLAGRGATAFVKISARKARCFLDGKITIMFFHANDVVYLR